MISFQLRLKWFGAEPPWGADGERSGYAQRSVIDLKARAPLLPRIGEELSHDDAPRDWGTFWVEAVSWPVSTYGSGAPLESVRLGDPLVIASNRPSKC